MEDDFFVTAPTTTAPVSELPPSSFSSAMTAERNSNQKDAEVAFGAAAAQRGATTHEAQLKAVAERVAAADKKLEEKDAQVKSEANEYIRREVEQYNETVEALREKHKKEQATYEQKIDEMKSGKGLWQTLPLFVDLNKPNSFSRGTERMRKMLILLHERATHPAA